MNATRVFWDPTYTDATAIIRSRITPLTRTTLLTATRRQQAPQLIPMLQTWVANDYPGTKTAIDEYNFGGLESINGALAQADILGIFGRQDLGMGAFWPTTNYSSAGPGQLRICHVPQLRRERLDVWQHVLVCDEHGIGRRRGRTVVGLRWAENFRQRDYRMEPGMIEFIGGRATIHFHAEKYADAIADMTSFLNARPDTAHFRYYRGRAMNSSATTRRRATTTSRPSV